MKIVQSLPDFDPSLFEPGDLDDVLRDLGVVVANLDD